MRADLSVFCGLSPPAFSLRFLISCEIQRFCADNRYFLRFGESPPLQLVALARVPLEERRPRVRIRMRDYDPPSFFRRPVFKDRTAARIQLSKSRENSEPPSHVLNAPEAKFRRAQKMYLQTRFRAVGEAMVNADKNVSARSQLARSRRLRSVRLKRAFLPFPYLFRRCAARRQPAN